MGRCKKTKANCKMYCWSIIFGAILTLYFSFEHLSKKSSKFSVKILGELKASIWIVLLTDFHLLHYVSYFRF